MQLTQRKTYIAAPDPFKTIADIHYETTRKDIRQYVKELLGDVAGKNLYFTDTQDDERYEMDTASGEFTGKKWFEIVVEPATDEETFEFDIWLHDLEEIPDSKLDINIALNRLCKNNKIPSGIYYVILDY